MDAIHLFHSSVRLTATAEPTISLASLLALGLGLQAIAVAFLGWGRRLWKLAEYALCGTGLIAGISAVALAGDGQVVARIGFGATPLPYALGLGVSLQRTSSVMVALVALLGWSIFRYSVTYLRTESGQLRFLRWLSIGILLVELFVLSSNLLGNALLWILASAAVHRLLRHYDERTRARIAARKKFIVSRIGDAAFWTALGLLYAQYGTLDISELIEVLNPSARTAVAAHLVVLAVLLKSAQFPFHTWLPETMDAPTPVSAFMHAGVINAGAYLLLLLSPLLSLAPSALMLLLAVGSVTAAFGTLVGGLQPTMKLRLAYSTMGQMGFLFFELGLGLTGAAALHLVAHAIYKAHLFLRSGSAPAETAPVMLTPRRLAGALLTSLAILSVGYLLMHQFYREFALAYAPLAVVWAIGLSQYLLGPAELSLPQRARSFALVGLSLWGFVLLAESTLTSWFAILPHAHQHSVPGALLVACAVGLVGCMYFLVPLIGHALVLRRLKIHALSGFYLGDWSDRIVHLLWPDSPAEVLPAIPRHPLSTGPSL